MPSLERTIESIAIINYSTSNIETFVVVIIIRTNKTNTGKKHNEHDDVDGIKTAHPPFP